MTNKIERNVGRETVELEDHNDLDSWKEIGVYLNRTVRTVQRWEKSEGLPIHRHGHDRGSSVSACKREVDQWQKQRMRISDEIRTKQKELKLQIERLRAVLLMKRMQEALAIALEVEAEWETSSSASISDAARRNWTATKQTASC